MTDEEVYNTLHDEIKRVVDNDMLCGLMVDMGGWIRVDIDNVNDEKYKQIVEWVVLNIKDDYRGYYENWVFKSQDDALLFKLTWEE